MRIRTRSILIMTFHGITQATQLIIGIVLVRLISKETLGSYRQIALSYTLIAGILSLQIENSLYYFLPKFGKDKSRELITQTLLTTGILSLLIGLVMFFSADIFAKQFNNPELANWIRIFSVFPILQRIICLQPAFLISLDKALFSGFYSMLSSLLMISTVVIVFALGYGITQAVIAKIAVAAIFAVIGVLIMVRFSNTGQWRIDKGLWTEQLNYCWPLMATTIVGVLNLKLDGVLISSYFSKDVYAVYSMGALELPLIGLFTVSLASAIMPNMVIESDKGNKINALDIWHQAIRKSSLLIFPAFVFFLICGYDFIVFLYTKDYSQAAWPFLIYLARLPIRVAIYGAIFRAIGHTKPIAIAALLAFISNIIISITLLVAGRHGFLSYIGPSIGTSSSTVVSFSFLLIILCKRLDIRFVNVMKWKELGRILGLSLLCGAVLWLVPMPFENLFIKLVIRFVLYVLLFFASLVMTKSIHPDEWELLCVPITVIKKLVTSKASQNEKRQH